MKKVLLAAVAVAALAGSAHADLLAYWNFNNSIAGNPSGNLGVLSGFNGTGWVPDAGSGLMTTDVTRNTSETSPDGTFGTFGGDTLNALFGDAGGGALAVQNGTSGENNGKYVQFEVSTVGFEDVILSYATRGTSTGFNTHSWSYSVNGGGFIPLTSHAAQNTSTWVLHTADLSAVAAADNVASLVIRLTFSGGSTTSSAGNNRYDNVQINATQIPTPGALALVGMGGLVAARRRRA